MTGLLGMFAKAPRIEDKIVFSDDGLVQEVVMHRQVAHGVTGAITYSRHGKQYLCRKATLSGPKEEIIQEEQLPIPLKDIFEVGTRDKVKEVLVKYRRSDCYQLD